jgi:hypothetical protein
MDIYELGLFRLHTHDRRGQERGWGLSFSVPQLGPGGAISRQTAADQRYSPTTSPFLTLTQPPTMESGPSV